MTIKGKSWNDPEKITWLLFMAVAVGVYFFALDVPLLGPDEPRYAQVAREMYERGDLVTPTLGGFNWFEKPALLYWLQFVSYSLFGISEFAARFGSAIFGLCTVVSLWLLGNAAGDADKRISNFGILFDKGESNADSNHSRPKQTLGPWLGLIAATSLGLLVFSRGASFDIIIAFPVTASLVSFFIYDQSGASTRFARLLPLFGFYFFIGLGLIAKGLIGAVFPLAIAAFYFLLSRRWPSRELVLSVIWGSLVAAVVAGFWYVPMFIRHGWEFWDEFFIQHHFQRYTSNKYSHPGPFWYFWLVLPAMTFPWIPFFIAAVWKSVRRVVFGGESRSSTPDFVDKNRELVIFAFSWLLVPLVFFSLSGSKLPGYILPALAPAIVITALFVHEFAAWSYWRSFAMKSVAFLMLAGVTFILAFALPKFAREDSVKFMIETADSRGYSKARILNMHNISQNAEFYGAGRLFRDEQGNQWKFLGVPGIVEFMRKNDQKSVLVLIPREFESHLTSSELVKAEALERSGELSIVAVELYSSKEGL